MGFELLKQTVDALSPVEMRVVLLYLAVYKKQLSVKSIEDALRTAREGGKL